MASATSRPHGIPARPHPESTAVLERLVAGQVRRDLRFQGLHQQRLRAVAEKLRDHVPGLRHRRRHLGDSEFPQRGCCRFEGEPVCGGPAEQPHPAHRQVRHDHDIRRTGRQGLRGRRRTCGGSAAGRSDRSGGASVRRGLRGGHEQPASAPHRPRRHDQAGCRHRRAGQLGGWRGPGARPVGHAKGVATDAAATS